MLTQENIIENYERFVRGVTKCIPNGQILLEKYGQQLQVAPATTTNALFGSYPGGLIEHILEMVICAGKINKALRVPIDTDKLTKVVLLAEIGKANLYVFNTGWSPSNQVKAYDFNPDLVSMTVGERSLYYALSCGCELTEDEAQAILNYEKDEEKSTKWHTQPIGKVLKFAFETAIINEKTLNNERTK